MSTHCMQVGFEPYSERIRKFFQKYPGACMEAGKSYMIYKYKYMYMYVWWDYGLNTC